MVLAKEVGLEQEVELMVLLMEFDWAKIVIAKVEIISMTKSTTIVIMFASH